MFTRGGHKVGKGTYWNMVDGSRIDMDGDGILPGGHETMYIKAPSALVLAAGPVLGLVFAVFLPFIGIAMAAMLIIRKIGVAVRETTAAAASFAWRPVEAYLAGRKKRKSSGGRQNKNKS